MRIKDAEDLLRRLATDREGLSERLSHANAVLEQAAAKRQTAEEEREAAVNRWWGCVDTGLPRCAG